MKILNKNSFTIAAAIILTSVTGCKKLLVEQPRSGLYPDYFSTAGGVQAAVTGVYQDLRGAFSGEGLVYFYDGTDENIPGGSAGTNPPLYNSFKGITASNGPDITGLYIDINTLNGVFQNSALITDPTARTQFVAQAKFLRGFIYFWLVQTYGGVTATQKSGIPLHLTFNTQAASADAPAKLSDIYNAIIQDFTDAATGLPNTITSSNPFSAAGIGKSATAATAKAFLAKAYLTRGYTEAKQSTDFQQAADITAQLITNKATYGLDLWQDYWDEHKPANDYGKENLFAIDYGISDPLYSNYTQQGSGGYGINQLYVLARFNYVGPGVDNVPGVDAVPQKMGGSAGMVRDVYNGRPYVRLAPNKPYTMDVAFADQIHDTRYDATFQTYWICTNPNVSAGLKSDRVTSKGKLIPTTSSIPPAGSPLSAAPGQAAYITPMDGDTAILMPSADVSMARRDAFKGLIVTPKQFNSVIFPTVKKFDDPKRTGILDFSSRPIILMRFSEVYLMNAEANYMLGNIPNAATSLNVIRQRAAYRTTDDANLTAKNQFYVTSATMGAANTANAAAMALTPAQLAQLAIPNNTTTPGTLCGMDLILDEYSREFYGDPRRWYDLVRTQQLVRRNKMYNAVGGPNVQDYHARWPIPQGLINAVLTGPAYPQNNGY
ncbi:RagB/SusD family nutrient uptake outer membrane protein [Mucilaginibacter boryungensis]|uniref:RagB/SusD family nutrient uptake outer membrane protein n=1 Tax=Mucilaginibacter boryungensis TaxID=768480 RepID=A0ABR9XEL4_9SPHI|nr:RagB/SusD family nutrient uptake outer membrane protein [Mucilaginibacter boryungensis]MBE9665514.1 RagB/SusD family nutrient uptake outer membrane protein [Mucilaginibacter boryungensis]